MEFTFYIGSNNEVWASSIGNLELTKVLITADDMQKALEELREEHPFTEQE